MNVFCVVVCLVCWFALSGCCVCDIFCSNYDGFNVFGCVFVLFVVDCVWVIVCVCRCVCWPFRP